MRVAFFWNYLNHHQVLVADEMRGLLGEGFVFVATLPRDEGELKGGEDYSTRPYCLLSAESAGGREMALRYAREADVCVFGACSQEYAVHRAVNNPGGLSLEVGERWLKRGLMNVVSPVLLRWWLNYRRYYRRANFYKLCSSAFAAADDELLGCYCGRHFKWGYFTEVDSEAGMREAAGAGRAVRLMWCARFIGWKHPELAIGCAGRLKAEGCDFVLDMYGDGVLRGKMEEEVRRLGLAGVVRFHGNVGNDEIRRAMCGSDIFLLTSDRQEGWGAVANEAMAAGCCLVGSDESGAVPYLVRDGENGAIFRSESLDSLCDKVMGLIGNRGLMGDLAARGCADMSRLWSPGHAARSLVGLIDDLRNGRDTHAVEGPCSKA